MSLHFVAFGVVGFSLLSGQSSSFAQTVAGARLGVTTIEEVRSIRGEPESAALTESGVHRYLVYGDRAFYFDSDSVAIFVRIFISGTRTDIEEIFGQAYSETRLADLSLSRTYSDTVSVLYESTGESVFYIEYRQRTSEGKKAFDTFRLLDSLQAAAVLAEAEREREDFEREREENARSRRSAGEAIVKVCEAKDDRITESDFDRLSISLPPADTSWLGVHRAHLGHGTACLSARESLK